MYKILIIIFTLLFFDIYGAIFSTGKIENKTYTIKDYYNSRGISEISIKVNECDKRNINCNTDIVINSNKNDIPPREIFNFDFGKLKIVAKGKYLSHTAVIIEHKVTIKDKITKLDKKINTYWLISNKSGKYIKAKTIKPNSKLLKEDDSPLIPENFGLINFKIKKFISQSNPDGKISSALIDKDNHLRISNGKKWIKLNNYSVTLQNALSVWPDTNSGRIFVVIYKYINPFNKGIDLIVADFDKNESFYTTVYNSDENDFGNNSEIFTDNDKIFITGYSKTLKQKQTISLKKDDLENIKYKTSPYIKGFEKKQNIFFSAGTYFIKGISNHYSLMKSKTKNDILSFNINSCISATIYDLQINLHYSSDNTSSLTPVSGNIEYKYKYLLTGLFYSNYNSMNIIKLKNSDSEIIYDDYGYITLNNFGFITEYNQINQININEVNYNNFYINGKITLGLSTLTISENLKSKLNITNKQITDNFSLNTSLNLETGYIFQRKFRQLKGAGYYITAGYKINTNLIYTFNSGKKPDNNELLTETQNIYIEHGPFISFNLIW